MAGVDEAPLRLVAQAPLGWARVDVAPVRRWLLSGAMAAPDVEGKRGCVGSIDEEVSRRGHWQRTPDTGHGHSLHCNRRRMYGTLATGYGFSAASLPPTVVGFSQRLDMEYQHALWFPPQSAQFESASWRIEAAQAPERLQEVRWRVDDLSERVGAVAARLDCRDRDVAGSPHVLDEEVPSRNVPKVLRGDRVHCDLAGSFVVAVDGRWGSRWVTHCLEHLSQPEHIADSCREGDEFSLSNRDNGALLAFGFADNGRVGKVRDPPGLRARTAQVGIDVADRLVEVGALVSCRLIDRARNVGDVL